MKTWEPHPEGPHSHEAASVSGADYDPSARPEGEPCSSLERNRVCEEGNQMGEWDASQERPMNPNIASGYPEGSTLDLDYCAGYRSGYRSYQAEIQAGKVLQWRNKRRSLRGLKPVKDWDYYAKLLTELKLRRETDDGIGLSIDISRAEAGYAMLPPKPRDK